MTLPPTALIVEALQQLVLPPLVIGATLLLASRFVARKHSGHIAAVVAFMASLAVGNWLASIHPNWWPETKRSTWLPWLAAAATISGLFVRPLRWNALGYSLFAAVLAVAAIRLVPKDYHTEPLWALPAFALLIGLVGFGLLHLGEAQPGVAVPLLLATSLLTAGGVIIYAHSKSLMDLTTIGGYALIGLAIVAAFTKADVGAVYPGATLLLVGALFAAYHETYSDVPAAGFAIPALAPLLGLVGLLPLVRRLKGWLRVAIVLGPAFIALGVALGLAMANESLALDTEPEW